MKNISKKILAVMAEIGKVSKDKRNDFHKYNYASDEAIVTEIREAMIRNGLVVIPNQTSILKEANLTQLCVEYTMLDSDSGESIVSRAYGQGLDSGDKGVYKAATGAEKYYLLKTFLIATTDDPENEKGTRAPYQPKSPPNRAVGAQNAIVAQGSEPEWQESEPEEGEPVKKPPLHNLMKVITQKQRGLLFVRLKKSGKTEQDLKSLLLDRYGLDSTSQITMDLFEDILTWVDLPMVGE